MPGGGASKHEVRDVGASDQQYQSNGAQDHEQRGAYIADDLFLERLDQDLHIGVGVGIGAGQIPADGVDFGLRG